MQRCKLAALLCALLLCFAPVCAHAAAEVFISVTATTQGVWDGEQETTLAELKAVSENAPMPAGSSNGVATLPIAADGTARFGPIACEELGEYYYTIRQLPGSSTDVVYDQQEYQLKIQVTVDEATGEKQMSVVLYQGDEGNKFDQAAFTNQSLLTPSPSPTVTVTPKPTHSGNLTPTGVQDYWPLYVAGMVLLGCISIAMIVVLCRKEDYDEAEDE